MPVYITNKRLYINTFTTIIYDLEQTEYFYDDNIYTTTVITCLSDNNVSVRQ